ncbi:MAG: magnesium transporter CorA family protein [Myxococcaceae bacterium]
MLVVEPAGDLSQAFWIDLVDPTAEEAQQVAAATGLRVPSRAQLSEIETSSRVSFDNGAFYFSSPMVAPERPDSGAAPAGFVVSSKVLVTVRFAQLPSFDAVHEAARLHPHGSGHACGSAPDAFLKLLEVIVDHFADALERAGADCEAISSGTFNLRKGQTAVLRSSLNRIGEVADRTSRIRDALLGLGRIIAFATEPGLEHAPELHRGRLKALHADLVSLTDYEGHLASKIQFLLDATLGFVNIEQNEIVKTLTVASVAGIPPVLIAGIYGMNFKVMPELSWPFGYPFAMALIVVSALIPVLWFKHRGWM